MKLYRYDRARFWSSVTAKDGGRCRPWLGETDKDNYGKFYANNKTYKAHRLAYALANDLAIDKLDGYILHSCDNPICNNPEHLSLGTHQKNMQEAGERGRLRTPTKLTNQQVTQIKKDSRSSSQVAAEYGVSAGMVRHIRRGLYWR